MPSANASANHLLASINDLFSSCR